MADVIVQISDDPVGDREVKRSSTTVPPGMTVAVMSAGKYRTLAGNHEVGVY